MKKVLLLILVGVVALSANACKRVKNIVLDWNMISNDLEIDTSKEVTVVFWHTMAKTTNPLLGQQALLEVYINEFKQLYPHITVLHESKGGYNELRDAVNTALPAGNEPNMVYSYGDHVAGYINSGLVLPLNNLINNKNAEIALSNQDIEDFVDGYWQEGAVYDNEGTMLNLPFLKSTEVLFYNKTFFNKHGLVVPTSWDETKSVAIQIRTIIDTHADFSGLTEAQKNAIIPLGYDSEANLYITASEQLKIPYTSINENLSGSIDFVNDQAKEMVSYFKDMYDNKLLTTKEMLGGDYTSNKFVTQSIFMSVGSTGGTNYNIPAGGDFEVGVASLPQFDSENKKVIQQGPNINLFLKSNIQEMVATWLFLKYITNREQTSRWAIATGYAPVRKSAFIDVNSYYSGLASITPTQRVFQNVFLVAEQQIPSYFTSPAFDKSSKARDQVGAIFINVFGNTYTIDEAFNKAYEEIVF